MKLKYNFFKPFFAAILLCSSIFTHAQFTATTTQTFNAANAFIENIGQYGTTYKGQENMGTILYGFEGHDMPILVTKKGLIFLQRKVESISHKEKEKLEKQGIPEEGIEHKKTVTDRAITMEWFGANSNVEIIQEEKTYDYHTYGLIKEKAYGYKKITYKNLYNGIDLVYSFTGNEKIGFEYSLHVSAGTDITQIKMQYGGDVKKIKTNKQGNLIIESDIDGIQQSTPLTFYTKTDNIQATNNEQRTNEKQETINEQTRNEKRETSQQQTTNHKQTELITTYNIINNQITFTIPQGYNNTKAFIIDPFISSTSNLDGANAGKAKDIDFDYAGNVYVTGGGEVMSINRLAKYNAAGVLQWTFTGILTNPVWQFGLAMGGWVVEKINGNIYLGQGGILAGFRVVRLNTNGLYDNYISAADGNFQENWKMYWSCANGNPQILIAGGGSTSNINLGVLSPPSILPTSINITGIPFVSPTTSGAGQDIADIVIDPVNNNMYTIFSSLLNDTLNNRIYKNNSPYSFVSTLWHKPSGFLTMEELRNRPYILPGNLDITETSANILALNPSYLFYWDGKNLKAFNKATGAGVGTPLITTNTSKMSGGIYADACNNVYVGDVNGTIKVYNFNGSIFSDAPTDILIAGFATKSVYDIAYNDADKLLYASGDGFVASFDIAATCPNNNIGFSLNIVSNCITASATAAITPAPPTGSVITYILFIGTTQIASNTTGIFTSLLPQTNYKITATINQTCSGVQVSNNFSLPSSTLPIVTTPITYCQGATAIALTATGTSLFWYTTATGGAGATIAPIPNTTTIGTTAYYVSQTTTGNCESPRAQINVQVIAALAAPIVTATITYCPGATATVLTASGTNLLWYTSVSGGGTGSTIAPIPSTATAGTTAYYVSQSNVGGSCESPRAQINVQVIAVLAAPIVTTSITYCQSATATALTATGTNLLWYTNATGGTSTTTAPIPSTTTVGTTTYYVSQSATSGSCESPRVQINVQITATLAAPIVNTPITYCQSATATALTAIGANLLWYTSATSGTGSTIAPIPSTTTVGTTLYYVSQSALPAGGGCESPRAAINVNITPLLTVNAGNTITIAAGTTTQLNATATGGADYTWSSTIAPISLSNIKILNPIANPLQTTTYLLTVKDLVGNCSVSSSLQVVVIGAQNCINIRNAFTPNGDGINDTWLVYDQDFCLAKDGVSVQIFNRYGSKVYENKRYKNTWNGTYNNKYLPDGTYYAVIVFTFIDGSKQYARSDVTILR